MLITRKAILDLGDAEHLIYRALCSELEVIQSDIAQEAKAAKPDLLALAAAMRDRRLAVQWLRQLRLPPASRYSSGPDLWQEEQILRESVDD